ncbi:hypothetical protein Taro_012006, partial [Colocasia esculenta]|nr:hypothetical protein [Colocasia esculenta]
LTNLKLLHLDWNSLTGPVPAFLGRMTSLEDIVLSFNKLSGSFPLSLGNLPPLRGLSLDRNQLTGIIPASIGRLCGADDLYFRLSHNRLIGPAIAHRPPPLFIDPSRNEFEFDLSGAEFSANLAGLDLTHNQVFGGIPAYLAKLQLHLFNVSYNRLCGEIPQAGRLDGFTEHEFFHNRCLYGSPLTPRVAPKGRREAELAAPMPRSTCKTTESPRWGNTPTLKLEGESNGRTALGLM